MLTPRDQRRIKFIKVDKALHDFLDNIVPKLEVRTIVITLFVVCIIELIQAHALASMVMELMITLILGSTVLACILASICTLIDHSIKKRATNN